MAASVPENRRLHPDPLLALIRAALLALMVLQVVPAGAVQLIEPEEAFQVEAGMVSPERMSVTWRIAEDHYMYRKAFSVQVVDGDVTLGSPEFPAGRKKTDEFFGETEIYDRDVTFFVPVAAGSGAPGGFTIKAVGQGCNEPVGVCFPPVSVTAGIELVAAQSNAPQSMLEGASSSGVADSLEALLDTGSGQREFMHPDEAFRFELTPMGPETVLARFFIEPGYYLYKDKFGVASPEGLVEVTGLDLPRGVKKNDEYFGQTVVYYDAFDAQVNLRRDTARAGEVTLNVGYQGCAEAGICYPPIEKQVSLRLPGVSDAAASYGGAASGTDTSGGAGSSVAWPVLLAFGSGLLLTFTPCVLPMIPILAGILVGQGGGVTRLRSGGLASVYVLGTAVTYTAVGVVAGLTGDQLQAYFQNAWAIGLIAALLSIMALAMFGLFELKMPSAIQTRLQHRATALEAGAFGGVFAMGVLSALIVGACVSPVLISVLSLAISRGDPVLGGVIMFAMAMGMGLFLIAIGFGFGHVLPKAGPWMERVKHAFGVMLLAVVIYLLGALPQVPVLYLWAALLIGTAIYLGAGENRGRRNPLTWLRQGAAVALVAWGVLAALGGAAGNRDILHPVDFNAVVGNAAEHSEAHADFRSASSPGELDRLMETARKQGKPVMIDYYADWCQDCIRMEQTTFREPAVAAALNEEFVLIQVDVTDPDDAGTSSIKQEHGVFGPPAMLFFDDQGREVASMRRYGYLDSEEFLDHIAPLRDGRRANDRDDG